ncbi:MarR family winged helix-turn-helix transcriptional regulator [Galbitalea soli]|uniref:MarR family transcriptional regulator n=1 Tax=Galbitalea soli TaxID=1268042 RepID=A0A7C9TR51_9MICO|nr:MarR family transcriptional regulator [Galbitalea soli]NEM91937.1 MarR family transcriptional regulator [Galbitalea soli]NYJ32115.1 DNA-binding MarR family transcriptional regulator [Galbitalea soli]
MTPTTASESATRLGIVAGRLNRRLLSATGGLSHGLLSSLSTVVKSGPLRLADLAQLELVSAPSITRVVAELEARGLVQRASDPQDGRAVLISATAEGRAAVLRARAARAEVIAGLLVHLSPEDVAAVEAAIPALERMIDAR